MAVFHPAWSDVAGLLAVLLVGPVLLLIGRVLSGGRAVPEISLVAGWGALCALLTVWGVATPLSMRIPAAGAALLAVLGIALPRLRPRRQDWIGLGRILIIALPLLAVMAPARPSQTDTFLNLLPDAVYLFDHASFPADGRPDSFSFLPAAPYNLQFAGFLASMALGRFPPAALAFFNVLLHIAFGLLLARMLRAPDREWSVAPSWAACAGGLLLATGLNPGFVPRIHFASYSEASVAVTLGIAGWLASRAWTAMAERRPAGKELWLLCLVLLAMVNIKQESPAFVAGLEASVVAFAGFDRKVGFTRVLCGFVPAAVPASLLFLAWHWFVATHFSGGAQLEMLPVDQWQFENLPLTLLRILHIMTEKIVFFSCVGASFVAFFWLLRKTGFDNTTRLLAMSVGMFLAYNFFLLFMYAAHFPGVMSTNAHSYFRYNTHLSLLLVISLVAAGRDIVLSQPGWLGSGWRRACPGLVIVTMLLLPLGFAKRLRFDLDMPQPIVWDLAKMTAQHVTDGDKLALILPGDNYSVWWMLKGVLMFTPPRRTGLDVAYVDAFDSDTLTKLAAAGYHRALLSCPPPGGGDFPPRSAVFLEYRTGAWQAVEVWPYPPIDPRKRWQPMLASAPLCR